MRPTENSERQLAGRMNGLQLPAFLANFLEIAFDAVAALDSQRRITFWNPAAEQMYGWMSHEAVGKTPAELFWPLNTPRDEEEESRKQLQLERGGTVRGEYRPCRKDGSSFWVEYAARAIFDQDGRISGYVAVYRDITEKKRTENEIRLISRMPAENPNPVMRLTPEGRVLYANDASVPLLEYWIRPDGQTLPDELQKHMTDVFASGTRKVIEIEHQEQTFSFTLAPIREAGYVNFYGSDITRRKKVENELARERELLERLFESIPVMLTIYEPSTNLLRLNAQFERLTGWHNDEASGLSLMEACYPDPGYREQVRQFMEMCAENQWMDIRMRTRDGRTLETSWANIRLSNEMQVGIGIDITERKHTERALAEFARQQEALYNLADQLHRTNSLEEAYRAALDAILRALLCDRASILLYDDEGMMRFVAWRGLSDDYRRAVEGHSPWEPGAAEPEPVCIGDIGAADLTDSLKAVIAREGIRSLAFIPLISNKKLIGKFMVYFDQPHVFTGDEQDTSQTIAHQLAFGIERNRAAAKLRESEERYRTIVDTANEGVWYIDAQSTTVYVNEPMARILGYSADDIVGHTVSEFCFAEDIPEARRHIASNYASIDEHFDFRFRRKDGSEVLVLASTSPVRDGSGAVLGALGMFVDITERKRAEEALRQSEDRFRTLANTVPSIVWTAAPDGTIVYANQQWYEYTGLSPEQNSREWPEVLHPDDHERCVSAWRHALRTVPDEYLIEIRNRRRDGEYRWFQTRAVPARDSTGRVIAWYGVTTDIHERIEDEKRLALLAEISEMMRNFEDADELLYAVSVVVGEHLQVQRCLFNEIDLKNDLEIVRRDYCSGVESVAGEHRISDYSHKTSAEMRAGKTVVNYDSKTDPRTAADYERIYAMTGERAYVAVPMMRENRWVASLWVSADAPRMWSKDDVFLLESVAERSWTVIEKLRINAALRASEALYRTIARSIPGGGVYVVDKDFRYLIAEGPVTEAFGLTREMLEGYKVSEAFPDERGARMEERLKRNFVGETVSFETNHNGRVYWTQQAPLLDSIGHAIILTIDITERKQAEELLRRNEELFSTLVEAAPFGVYFIDSEFRLLAVNKGSREVFAGIEPLIGRDFAEILRIVWQEPFATEAIERFRHTLQTGEPFISPPVTEERANIDEIQSYDWQIHRITLPDGAFGVVCYYYDLSEQKRMEAAVRISEERYRNLFELVPVAVYSCDADGLIQEYNQRAAELWGREPAKNHPGERYCGSFRLYYADGRLMPPVECPMSRVLRGETPGPDDVEIMVERPDGTRRNIIAHPLPLKDEQGHTVAAITCLYDITERKQVEQALHENQKQLQQLNETLEQRVREQMAEVHRLASDLTKAEQRERHRIAHILHDDLQQRLYAIKMQMLPFRDALAGEDPAVEQDFEEISGQLDDVLMLTRHLSIDLSPPILHDEGLAHAIGWLAAQMYEQHNLQIDLQAEGSFAIADDDMQVLLYNCVHELLFNIVKHAGVKRAVVSLRRTNRDLQIEVRDEGKGFDLAGLERRVEASQEDEARPRSSFGLPTLRHRLSLFGGRMEIESQPGVGTLVTMTIPVYQEE